MVDISATIGQMVSSGTFGSLVYWLGYGLLSVVMLGVFGVTYYFLRRLPNPNLSLLDSRGNIKKDLETQQKLETYYYDAVYGGFAIGVSHFVVRLFRESTRFVF